MRERERERERELMIMMMRAKGMRYGEFDCRFFFSFISIIGVG